MIPEFGTKLVGQEYRPRPGAYGVLFAADGRIAMLKTGKGYYLPGGGAEPGETPEQTLMREIAEECGLSIQIGARLGEAVEYVYAAEEATYFAKQGLFFVATTIGEECATADDDSTLLWLTPERALELLTHRSQAWAVHLALVSPSE